MHITIDVAVQDIAITLYALLREERPAHPTSLVDSLTKLVFLKTGQCASYYGYLAGIFGSFATAKMSEVRSRLALTTSQDLEAQLAASNIQPLFRAEAPRNVREMAVEIKSETLETVEANIPSSSSDSETQVDAVSIKSRLKMMQRKLICLSLKR